MLRKILAFALVAACVATDDASARAAYDSRDKIENHLAKKRKLFNITDQQTPARERVRMGEEPYVSEEEAAAQRAAQRASLGSAAAGSAGPSSPGFTIATTYMDDQYRNEAKGHQVDFRGEPDIIFTYSDAPTAGASSRFGYNAYAPNAGPTFGPGFGYGTGAGATPMQAADETGRWSKLDVLGGVAFIVGIDNSGATEEDNVHYRESQHQSGFFSQAPRVTPAQYQGAFLSASATTDELWHPVIEVQVVGADTITHILAGQEGEPDAPGGTSETPLGIIQYFRRVNSAGAWTGGILIDSISRYWGGALTASRVSNRVAVSYAKVSATGLANDQRYDNDIYVRISSNAGVTWGPKTNITSYSRILPSYTANFETHNLFDTQDELHVVFQANSTPADVYNDAVYFWGDFSCSIFHWYEGTGNISRVHNAEWGIAQNTQVCGFGSPQVGYVGFNSISECDGKLYIIGSQYLNFFGDYGQTSQIDDCVANPANRLFAANGEVLLWVSGDLTGLLWDAARNLTNTYTPECDSATGAGGLCMNDTRASMSRYGQLVSGSWTWPGSEKVDPSGTYTGNHYLHIQYLEDHHPGPGWRGPATYGPLTANPVKWMRLACVNPIVAARISTDPIQIGYPDYVKHGQSANVTITVRNDGNAALNVTDIVRVKTTQTGLNWLTTSTTTMTVPAGLGNTATFTATINNGGAVNSPGTVVALDGFLIIQSNAANSPSDSVQINYIVADTVVDVAWDTVRTDVGDVAMAPGRVALVVSNHGEMGRSGLGKVNLDYAANGVGVECDTSKSVYLYSGAPIILRNEGGGNYSLSSSIFQQNFGTEAAFKPVHNRVSPLDISNADYSGYRTGTFVNEDSTICVEREYYAPKGGGSNSDFVIIRTKFYSYDGLAHNNLMLGEMIDWDVPASEGATNKTAIEGNTVIVRGTDTGTVACSNKNRFAASYYLGLRKSGEPACANDANKHGQFASRNDSTVFEDSINNIYPSAALWTKSAVTGQVALPPNQDSTDVNIITTYKHGYTLGASESLYVWSAVTTVRQGTQADLAANFANACAWYQAKIRTGCTVCGCCVGSVGNVDADPGDAVDISDLTVLIDHLFINNAPLVCPDEGNTDGNPGVDISDLTVLIDHLFINNNPLPAC